MRVYFAHPITDYGTERERDCADGIELEGWEIENPNQPHHQSGYDKDGMTYFENLAAACDALVFVRFPNGAIGAGVGKEIDAAQSGGKPIFEYYDGELHSVCGWPTPVLSIAKTRALIANLRAVANA